MRKEAAGKGWKPEEAVAGRVYVTRCNNERSGKLTVSIPGHRTLPITSARELIQLVGQRCLDAYVMKVPANTWIAPRSERDLPPPVNRASGGNREPGGKGRKEQEKTTENEKKEDKAKGKPEEPKGEKSKREEKQQEEQRGEKSKKTCNKPEEKKGEGDEQEDSPEKNRDEGEKDVSLEGSPVLEVSSGEDGEERNKKENGRKTFTRKARFDWNEGRYV